MSLTDFVFLLQGLKWTLGLTAIGFLFGIPLGFLVALARTSNRLPLRRLAQAWIALFQGTPLLMQLFVTFFGLPLLGVQVPSWLAVSIAFAAHASAYLGDIWRGAIEAVPAGQSEACHALGLGYASRMRDVVLPQAFKLSLPATVGFLVQLIKGTSLAAIVGFVELSRSGQMLSNLLYRPLLVFSVVASMYFALCWPISLLGTYLEKRMTLGRR